MSLSESDTCPVILLAATLPQHAPPAFKSEKTTLRNCLPDTTINQHLPIPRNNQPKIGRLERFFAISSPFLALSSSFWPSTNPFDSPFHDFKKNERNRRTFFGPRFSPKCTFSPFLARFWQFFHRFDGQPIHLHVVCSFLKRAIEIGELFFGPVLPPNTGFRPFSTVFDRFWVNLRAFSTVSTINQPSQVPSGRSQEERSKSAIFFSGPFCR